MTEININNPPPHESAPVEPESSDRTGAAAINLLTVLIVVVAVIAILWFLFNGPFQMMLAPATPTNINVNPPARP